MMRSGGRPRHNDHLVIPWQQTGTLSDHMGPFIDSFFVAQNMYGKVGYRNRNKKLPCQDSIM